MTTLAATTMTPSQRYGLYQMTSARRRRNHAPQICVLNVRISEMIGLAINSNNRHEIPDQKSIAKKMPTNTRLDPRSFCPMTSNHGIPTIRAGFHRSTRVLGGSLELARALPSISTTVSFASSDGWPSRTPPITSQLLVLSAVPAPDPMKSNETSSRIVKMYIGTASHSSSRTDALLMANAPETPRASQTSCRFHAPLAASVGMSVCPAEYTMAIP